MKPSHLTTPRSMSDGCWMFNADPIERPHGGARTHPADAVVIVLAVLVFAAILMGSL